MIRGLQKIAVMVLFVAMSANPTAVAHSNEFLSFRPLTAVAQRCLSQILKTGGWRYSPDFHDKMIAAAAFAEFNLNGVGRKEYLYIIDFSYGTAGCAMLIGEPGNDGACREIFDGSGFRHAIQVLRKRDHGYRRLYIPCELRFNGHMYREVRWQCPTLDIQR
jgi:hypothetical protein